MEQQFVPPVGGSRTLDQIEALAALRAGQDVDPDTLHPADRPAPAAAQPTSQDEE